MRIEFSEVTSRFDPREEILKDPLEELMKDIRCDGKKDVSI